MGLARLPSVTGNRVDRRLLGFDLESAAICVRLIAFEINNPVDVRPFPCWRLDGQQEIRMFNKIMAPVDLAHLETQGKAMQCAADMARVSDAEVCYVGLTTATPGPLGHTPAEFEAKLATFAQGQADSHGHSASHKMMITHDPTTDVDDMLLDAVSKTDADLVVMATHKPGLGDYVWPSNGGKLSAHAKASVFLVRG
jgi:nucleotide-binding universal stress UspA family protein